MMAWVESEGGLGSFAAAMNPISGSRPGNDRGSSARSNNRRKNNCVR
jgi:hypothetical protein